MYLITRKINPIIIIYIYIIIAKIRKISGLNSWKNTYAVIKWFSKLGDNKKLKFLVFDVEKFYPSITSELLLKALNPIQVGL